MTTTEIWIRLIVSILISGLVGFDREYKNRPAGLRTHILVCLGATLVAMVQKEISHEAIMFATANPTLSHVVKTDEARLVAQVISGIGFLGAGTIIVTNHSIKGLTTAASLWAVACLGISTGMGFYKISLIGTFLIMIVLTFLNKWINIPTLKKIEVSYVHKQESKEFIADYFLEQHILIKDVNFDVEIKHDRRIYTNVYTIETPRGLSFARIVEDLSMHQNMMRVRLLSI